MKFDIRNKKPKLYNVAVVAGIAVLLLGVDLLAFGGGHMIFEVVVMNLFLMTVFLMLIDAFRKQCEYNPYSYNTIYYAGFALFVFIILALNFLSTAGWLMNPESYNTGSLIAQISNSSYTFMLISVPFLLVFFTGLTISNISLIRHEGRRITNLLGVGLAVAFTFGFLYIYHKNFYIIGSIHEVFRASLINNAMSIVFLYLECMMIGTMIANAVVVRYRPDYDKDYVIILGCGIRKDGTPLPLLAGRIDRAMNFAKAQKEATGKDITFITSGGQGSDEVISESQSMTNYLMEHGIDQNRIIQENKSTNTFQNLKYSKAIIDERNPDAKVIFSTTNYHVFRSGIFARRNKLKAIGIGAQTKWYFWPNASVREFIGLLTQHRVKQALVILGILIINVLLTWVEFYGV